MKNVRKTVIVKKRTYYRFLLFLNVEKGRINTYESWQKPLKILDYRRIMC